MNAARQSISVYKNACYQKCRILSQINQDSKTVSENEVRNGKQLMIKAGGTVMLGIGAPGWFFNLKSEIANLDNAC